MSILEFIIGLFALALIGAVQHPFIYLMDILFLVYANKKVEGMKISLEKLNDGLL